MGTKLFYNRRTQAEREQVRTICAQCPVRTICLDTALEIENGGVFRAGVWGGMTAAERAYEAEARSGDPDS